MSKRIIVKLQKTKEKGRNVTAAIENRDTFKEAIVKFLKGQIKTKGK